MKRIAELLAREPVLYTVIVLVTYAVVFGLAIWAT